ncbi:MAG TPA: hypothetical protein VFK89_06120 [Actinomycetota bacterium]|nr:hypothetical protein [Actinomycetota bacterium]
MARRLLAPLGALVFLLGVLPPAVASAAVTAPCRNKDSVLVLRDIYIEATSSAKTVRPGQTFFATLTATRPAHEDPLDQGQQIDPPASVPASDVNVGISIYAGKKTYFWASGVTDTNGQAKLKLIVPKSAEAGPARSLLFAQHWVNQSCPDVLENGFNEYDNFVTVKR